MAEQTNMLILDGKTKEYTQSDVAVIMQQLGE